MLLSRALGYVRLSVCLSPTLALCHFIPCVWNKVRLLTALQKHKGRVSEEGLERYGRRYGFDCAWEDTNYNGRKARTLVIAGKVLQLEITLENHVVVAVKVEFPMSASLVRQHETRVGEVLYQDLSLPLTQSPLTKKMDRFAANFERLAAFDKFSSMPGLDLLGAPAAMYESLTKLYLWDLARKRQDAEYADDKNECLIEKAVMCQEHGRPVMNERGRVGMALQYWTERRLVPVASQCGDHDFAANGVRVWSMLIGCAPLADMFHVPLRSSTDWISDSIDTLIPAASSGGGGGGNSSRLDWLDPPHMPLEGPAALGGVSIVQPDGTLSPEKYPNVMFVAMLDPPVVLPQGISQGLHVLQGGGLGANMWGAYESLVLPSSTEPNSATGGGLLHESMTRYSMVYPQRSAGSSSTKPWVEAITCHLSVTRGVYAHRLAEVPFAHPQQLVEMMPVLRQYAFLSTLLEKSCGIPVVALTAQDELDAKVAGEAWMLYPRQQQEELAKKLVDQSLPRWSYEVGLGVYPLPQLQLAFPMPSGLMARLLIEIRGNGIPHIVNQNLLPTDATGQKGIAARTTVNGKPLTLARLAKQLAIVEDIGLFCAWIRNRLG